MREALILAGGMGTRLGGLAQDTPKPLLEVGGRAFIDHLVWNIARHGVRRVVVSAGHRADALVEHFSAGSVFGTAVRVVVEPEPLGTGGAIAYGAAALEDAEALVVNGDTLFDINYLDLALLRREAGVPIAMALRAVPDAGRYGSVVLDGTDVRHFAEKAGSESGLVNGGVYAAETEYLRSLSAEPHSFENVDLPALAGEGRLAGRAYGGWFIDIGTPESIEEARELLPAWRHKPAVLLDRDGVLNVDHGHVATPERFEWVPGAVEALRLINDAGALAIVVSNQAGIAKGFYTEEEFHSFMAWVSQRLAEKGAHLDAVYHCPHHPDFGPGCDCRKPGPGMVRAAIDDFALDAERTVLLGDKPSDVAAAEAAGVRGVLYEGGDLRDVVIPLLAGFGAD